MNGLLKKYLYPILIFAVVFLTVSTHSEAATFSLSSPMREVGIGGAVKVLVNLDAKGESINAVEGKILVPKKLKALDINDGNSIVNFWVERPRIADGNIVWSGIIPGGYTGTKGLLFSVTFEGVKNGKVELAVSNANAFLNDGKGTKVSIIAKTYILYVRDKQTATFETSPPSDTDIPELFTPLLSKDPNLFGGKYFIAFATQDKQSGIDHYEVVEQVGFRAFTYKHLPFVVAESPYLLTDQTLRSNIYVKAVDKQGNIRVKTISPTNQPLLYDYATFLVGFIISVCLVLFLRRFLS